MIVLGVSYHARVDAGAHDDGGSQPLQATDTPSPTPSPTASVTPSSIPTEAPTLPPPTQRPTRTPTQLPSTHTPTPTLIALPPAGSRITALPLPPPQLLSLAAPKLRTDLIDLIGGTRDRPIISMQNDLVAIYAEGRIWITVMRGDKLDTIGTLNLRQGLQEVRYLQFVGETLVIVQRSLLVLIDISQPDSPRYSDEIDLPFTPYHYAASGTRLYLAELYGLESEKSRLAVFNIPTAKSAELLHIEPVYRDRIYGLVAGENMVALRYPDKPFEVAPSHWHIFDTSNPSVMAPMSIGIGERNIYDISGNRILTGEVDRLYLDEIQSASTLKAIGLWDYKDRPLTWAQISGDGIQASLETTNSDGEVIDTELIGLALNADGVFTQHGSAKLSKTRLYTGWGGDVDFSHWRQDGKYCYQRDKGLGCYGSELLESWIDLDSLSPGLERSAPQECQAGARWMNRIVVACGGELQVLSDRGKGRLRVESVIATNLFSPRLYSVAGTLYLHGASRKLAYLQSNFGRWETVDSGIVADKIEINEDYLIGIRNILNARPPASEVFIHDRSTLDRIGEVNIENFDNSLPSILAGEAFFFRKELAGWQKLDLGAAPLSIDAFPKSFAPFGLALSGDTGFALEIDGVLASYDVRDVEAPAKIGEVDLMSSDLFGKFEDPKALTLVGDLLFIDRGGGWLSRVDVSDASSPKRLAPQPVSGTVMKMEALGGGQYGILTNRRTIEVYDAASKDVPSLEMSWSPWIHRFGRAPGVTGRSIQHGIVGDRLFVSSRVNSNYFSYWSYDISNPRTPVREARYEFTSLPNYEPQGDTLAALADGGDSIQVYHHVDDKPMRLKAKWCLPQGRCGTGIEVMPLRAVIDVRGQVFALTFQGSVLEFELDDFEGMSLVKEWRLAPENFIRMRLIGDRIALLNYRDPPYLIDVSDPADPIPLGFMQGMRPTYAIVSTDSLAAFESAEEVIVTDVRGGEIGPVIARIKFSSNPTSSSLSGRHLYAIDRNQESWKIRLPIDGSSTAIEGRFRYGNGGGDFATKDNVLYYGEHSSNIRTTIDVLSFPAEEGLVYESWLPLLTRNW